MTDHERHKEFLSINDDYPILCMLYNEHIITVRKNEGYLNIEENCDNHFSVDLSANELRMLSDEFFRVTDILR